MLFTAVIFIIVLSILVFIHELGHFAVAILMGVRVEEFGFGLPPKARLIKTIPIRNSKVDLTLNWLPIGGFVRLAGEDEDEQTIEERLKKYKGKNIKQFFWARTKLERIAILLAGVTMNFILAVVITSGLLIHGIEEPTQRVRIDDVVANSPAEQAGLKKGDYITEIAYTNEQNKRVKIPTRIPDEMITVIRSNLGKEITLTVLQGSETHYLSLIPRPTYPQGEGPTGVKIAFDIQTLKYPWYQAPIEGFKLTLSRGKDMLVALATLPGRALSGQNVQDEVAGPIGIAQVTGQAARLGIVHVLNLMSILSLSLAMINVLPIPALDGGRILFVVIEAITGKRVHQGFERNAHQLGFLVLIGLILAVTFNDITRFFK